MATKVRGKRKTFSFIVNITMDRPCSRLRALVEVKGK
jgi:hypothetical protein